LKKIQKLIKSNILRRFILEKNILKKIDNAAKEKIKVNVSKSEYVRNDEKLSSKNPFRINDIIDSFGFSYKNMVSSEELNITNPLSYIDFYKEMENYKKNYDKFVRIANEYIHNIERRKSEDTK
jgi:hypothetical protein